MLKYIVKYLLYFYLVFNMHIVVYLKQQISKVSQQRVYMVYNMSQYKYTFVISSLSTCWSYLHIYLTANDYGEAITVRAISRSEAKALRNV